MEGIPSNNLRVALYARVSTEEQREGQTIDSQVAELERHAQERGWSVIGVYKDEGWSGSLLARPALDRLRDDTSKGLFNTVLINDVDRLARDVTHLGVIKRDLERHGQHVIFRKLPMENSPTHNLLVNILGSFAEFERELIADRTRRGKRHKVEVRKEFLGSIPPYGFRYIRKDRASGNGGILEINPEEAAVARQMYQWVSEEGLSARRVLDRLNQKRIPPRKGNSKWAKSSVLRILRSEVYPGVWHYNKNESCLPRGQASTLKYKKTQKSSMRLRPRADWLEVLLPAALHIVTRDQWQRVQRQIDRNIVFSPRNEKHQYLLKGLVHCGGCGARYVGQPCHGKFYYRCMSRCKRIPSIREQALNQAVWQAVEEAMQDPNLIADQVPDLNARLAQDSARAQNQAAEIDQAVEQVRKEESRLIEAYRLGVLSPVRLAEELEKVNKRSSLIHATKVRLTEGGIRLSMPAVRKSVAEYCKMAAQRLKALALEGRQQFLRFIIRDIVFDGVVVRIRGAIPVSEGLGARSAIPSPLGGVSAEHIATTELASDDRNVAEEFHGDQQGGLTPLQPAISSFSWNGMSTRQLASVRLHHLESRN
jgi:site-specific DNA recombinase